MSLSVCVKADRGEEGIEGLPGDETLRSKEIPRPDRSSVDPEAEQGGEGQRCAGQERTE